MSVHQAGGADRLSHSTGTHGHTSCILEDISQFTVSHPSGRMPLARATPHDSKRVCTLFEGNLAAQSRSVDEHPTPHCNRANDSTGAMALQRPVTQRDLGSKAAITGDRSWTGFDWPRRALLQALYRRPSRTGSGSRLDVLSLQATAAPPAAPSRRVQCESVNGLGVHQSSQSSQPFAYPEAPSALLIGSRAVGLTDTLSGSDMRQAVPRSLLLSSSQESD